MKGKTARKKGAEKAKFRRRRMSKTRELTRIFRRKQRIRLKRKK
ncbi:MAG TPA: hypothetical protein VKB51_00055 [bacterium]|nr:hypothetical protein [bacterium]